MNFKYEFELLPRHSKTFLSNKLSFNKEIESIKLYMSDNTKKLDFILAPFFYSNETNEHFVLSKPIFYTCLAMLVKDDLYIYNYIQSLNSKSIIIIIEFGFKYC